MNPLQQELRALEPGQVRISWVEDLEALRSRKDEWNALVARNSTNTVFQTFEWQLSWWRAFGKDFRLLVLLADTEAGLVGLAPLLLSERPLLGRKRRMVEFIGTDSADYCDVIVAHPEVPPLLLGWLADHTHLWDVLHLSNIAETSPLVRLLPRFFGERGHLLDMHVLYECPTLVFGNPAEDRKLANKKSLKRHHNYFQRNGALTFGYCTDAAEIEGYLEAFFEQHVERWGRAGFPSQFVDERHRAFYRELVRTMTPTGWLIFAVLSFNQKPLAFHLGFEYDKRVFWIKPTFDSQYAAHSPGEVLLKYSLEDALDRKLAEFDFTVGEEAYKYRFANRIRLNYVARVYRRAIPYHLDGFLLRTKALAKRVPALRRLGRRLLRGRSDA